MNPFSTPVVDAKVEEKKEDDAPSSVPSIDFGVHPLQWLPYGMLPRFDSFQEEMTGNPASTLTPKILDDYIAKCIAMFDGKQWTEDSLDELLCLKLYSDCTQFQNQFRRSYWNSASIMTKREFYQWAIKMYQTFLYHAQPIPKSKDGMTTLYHGLNRLFQVRHVAQYY